MNKGPPRDGAAHDTPSSLNKDDETTMKELIVTMPLVRSVCVPRFTKNVERHKLGSRERLSKMVSMLGVEPLYNGRGSRNIDNVGNDVYTSGF